MKLIGANINFSAPTPLVEFELIASKEIEAPTNPGITYGQEFITSAEPGDAWYAVKAASIAAF